MLFELSDYWNVKYGDFDVTCRTSWFFKECHGMAIGKCSNKQAMVQCQTTIHHISNNIINIKCILNHC